MIAQTMQIWPGQNKLNYRVTDVRGFNERLTDQNLLCPMVRLSAVNDQLEALHELGVHAHISC